MNSDVMIDTLNFIKIFTNPKDILHLCQFLIDLKKVLGQKQWIL